MKKINNNQKVNIYYVLLYLLIIWSSINPKSYLTWSLEITPLIIASIIFFKTLKSSHFTGMLLTWVFIASCLTVIGGHFTFSEVPFFNWIKEISNLNRNHFDKLVHFVMGIEMSILTKEVLISKKVILKRNWINWISLAISTSLGVMYEFVEWGVAVVAGGDATDFLGAQGDIWDAQSDLFYAVVGSMIILFIFDKYHINKINRL